MSERLRPGVLGGGYPERTDTQPSWLERHVARIKARRSGERPNLATLAKFAEEVIRRSDNLCDASDDALSTRISELRPKLRKALAGAPLLETLAIIREQSRRHLGMAHFDVQIMAGCALLRGMLVELDTGEGKTLSGTLPAAAAALAGIPVHVVTVNDYLVERDAEQMSVLYAALGLSTGTVVDRDPDPETRRKAYACDITYVTNKQIAFDYLRDRLARPNRHEQVRGEVKRSRDAGAQGLLLRGLCFAILDEADSVLIDEARTPLILSRSVPMPGLAELAAQALQIAGQLDEKEHYWLGRGAGQLELQEPGHEKIEELSAELGGLWNAPARRAELVRVALTALHSYQRDEHYIVRDGKVEILDPQTGRSMPDRSWEGGLQQMVELKEGCEVSGEKETLARISYQQFYRRYLRLAGMTGTGREVGREIEATYGLPMLRIPPHRPSRRKDLGVRVEASAPQKWQGVVERIRSLHEAGRPVLVGTQSVRTSEAVSARLEELRLPHAVLNARHDKQEAEIIGEAGLRGRITVATAMAGRGSDIRVDTEVEGLGGLHVLSVERADSGRGDRQLFGRCGRQGDAGSFEQILSLDDDMVTCESEGRLLEALRTMLDRGLPGSQAAARFFVRQLQQRIERRHARDRARLLRTEAELERMLGFAGSAE